MNELIRTTPIHLKREAVEQACSEIATKTGFARVKLDELSVLERIAIEVLLNTPEIAAHYNEAYAWRDGGLMG